MGAAEAASEQMATGSATQVSVKTDRGTIVLVPGGSKVILAVLTEPESQLGLILFEMESRAKQVEEIFREI
ncbi:MAG TPA: roadblock/LC7 domain-containing protein, partial [Methanobacterium sp.]